MGKKGFINDSSLVGNDSSNDGDARVVAQEVTTHVVYIHPTNREYLDSSTPRGTNLNNMKYNVLNLT